MPEEQRIEEIAKFLFKRDCPHGEWEYAVDIQKKKWREDATQIAQLLPKVPQGDDALRHQIGVLMNCLTRLLRHLGVLNSDTSPNGVELVMATEDYITHFPQGDDEGLLSPSVTADIIRKYEIHSEMDVVPLVAEIKKAQHDLTLRKRLDRPGREKIIEIIKYGLTQYCRQNILVSYGHICRRIDGELAKKHAEELYRIFLALIPDEEVKGGLDRPGLRENREELVEKCMPTLKRFEEVEKQVFYPIPKPVEFSDTIRIYASIMSREAVRKTLALFDEEATSKEVGDE